MIFPRIVVSFYASPSKYLEHLLFPFSRLLPFPSMVILLANGVLDTMSVPNPVGDSFDEVEVVSFSSFFGDVFGVDTSFSTTTSVLLGVSFHR